MTAAKTVYEYLKYILSNLGPCLNYRSGYIFMKDAQYAETNE